MKTETFKQWWRQLEPRERKVLTIGGVVGGILLVYWLIWSPLSEQYSELHKQVAESRELQTWLNGIVPKIQQFKASGISAHKSNEPPLVAVNNSTEEAQLNNFVTQIKQTEDGQINITFATVPFDRMIVWLQNLWRKYGIEVSTLNVKPNERPGLVQANVTLQKK